MQKYTTQVQGPIPVEPGLQLMVIATSSLLEAVTRVIVKTFCKINIVIVTQILSMVW